MKRNVILGLGAAALTTLALASCGGAEGTKNVFIYNNADTYIGSVRAEMAKLDSSLTFHDAAASQETQNTQIDNAIAAGSKVLLINAVEPGTGETLVKKAKQANIPAIFFNREVNDATVNAFDKACFVGTDPDEAGYMQGELVAKEILKNPAKWDKDGDKKIRYVMLRAETDNAEANGRTKYSVQKAKELLEAAGYTLEQEGEDQMCSWATDKAKNAMDTLLSTNPLDGKNDIEVVFANNDDMALGAVQSLQGKGYNKADSTDDKKLLVVGVDATATAQDAIKKGTMFGSVKQDGEAMAKCLVALAKNAYEGKDFLEGTKYEWSKSLETGNEVRKIRIPYSVFTA